MTLSRLRLRKIVRDLWLYKTRTALVVLTIAIGVFAVGTISRTWLILSRDLAQSYASVNPASAILSTSGRFHDDLVEAVGEMAEIGEAEGRYKTQVQVQVKPNEWRLLDLITLSDYNDLRVNKVRLEQGLWPPPERTMLLERSSLGFISAEGSALSILPKTAPAEVISDTFIIEMSNDKQREITIAGIAHDLTQVPTPFSNIAYGYITPKTLKSLTGSRGYDQLHIVVAEKAFDEQHVQQVVAQVADKVEGYGLRVTGMRILDPGKHPLGDIIQSLLLILAALAILSLFLSAFLVINIISALLARQIPQIGAMKAMGACRSHIMAIYMSMVLLFGLLALAISIPASQLVARRLTLFLATLLNFNITNFNIPPYLYSLDLLAGLIVPLLAALIPIINGTRVTVHEAISYSGVKHNHFETTTFNRVVSQVRAISMPLRYALRNIFRHKTRLGLTLMTLTLAGAIFMVVLSVRASLLLTIDDVAAYWQQDIKIYLQSSYRIAKMKQTALSVAGVVDVEGRLAKSAIRLRPDGTQSQRPIALFGVSATTNFIKPIILAGRWLQPEDDNAIVINIDLLKEEADLSVGDEIMLKIGEREATWQVVGIVTGQVIGGGGLMDPIAYTNYPYLAQVTGEMGHASRLLIETERHDSQFQAEMAKALQNHFREVGLRIMLTELHSDVRTALENVFAILVALMFVMTMLLAIVGGLALMGMMSLNVLERTKEIGIVRVIGATNKMVMQIVIVEGIFIGILSWLLGALLALPLSKLLSHMVGITFLKIPLTYTFPLNGILLWLLIVTILSALASFLPARNAAQLSVHQTLAYE